jgi:hypothetical protein
MDSGEGGIADAAVTGMCEAALVQTFSIIGSYQAAALSTRRALLSGCHLLQAPPVPIGPHRLTVTTTP